MGSRPIHTRTKTLFVGLAFRPIISNSFHTMQHKTKLKLQSKDISDCSGSQTSGEPAAYSFGSTHPASSPPRWETSALDRCACSPDRPCAHTRSSNTGLTPQQTSLQVSNLRSNFRLQIMRKLGIRRIVKTENNNDAVRRIIESTD